MERHERLESTVIPVTRAIAWRPVTFSNHLVLPLLRSERSHFRAFITQGALAAAQDLARPLADGPSPGVALLTGTLHRCPRTRARFSVTDQVVPLGEAPDLEDDAARAAAWLRRRVEEVREDGRVVIGWAKGSGAVGHRLAPGDEAVHLRCFPEPYHVALALGDGTGGFLAYEGKVASTFLLPFHELLDREIGEDDPVPPATVLDWVNYEPARAVIGLRPEERWRLSGPASSQAQPGSGLLGTALGSIRGLMGGSRT